MAGLLGLLVPPIAAPVPRSQAAQEIRSENGQFLARVRPPSEIEVADVSDPKGAILWSARGLHLAPASEWRLTDDGRAVVAIDGRGVTGRALVQVVREGKLLVSADATALGLPADLLGKWLPAELPCIRLRAVERDGGRGIWLDLLGADDRVRSIDLASGVVRPPREEPMTMPPRVEPAAGVETEPVFVGEWFAPEACFAGEPLPVHVRGSLPTPMWKPPGFALEADPKDAHRLAIVARATPPPPGAISIQVLKGYDETATVHGLEPGLYSISVRGRVGEDDRPSHELRVLPAGTVAFVAPGGQLDEALDGVALLDDGRIEAWYEVSEIRCVALATVGTCDEIARRVAALPTVPAKHPAAIPANRERSELCWTAPPSAGGPPVRLLHGEGLFDSPFKEVAELLLRAAPPRAMPRGRYAIDLTKSFIEVRTESSGLLSAFGHAHRLMVRRFSGHVERGQLERPPAGPETWSVELEIDAASLAVVDDDSQSDRVAIEKEMNENVLEVARNPTIRFKSLAVEGRRSADSAPEFVVDGELSLHGATRRMRVPVRLDLNGDTLRATGAVSLQQSDFGIRPTSAVGGTVKVADRLRISFDVIAVAVSDRPR